MYPVWLFIVLWVQNIGAFIISLPIYKLGFCKVRKMFKNVKYSKKPSLVYSARSFFTSTIRLGSAACVFICVLVVRVEGLNLSNALGLSF